MEKYIKCYDRFNQELFEGDYVDVQKSGVHQIYKKIDGQLYFKPYGEEEMVWTYFSNDMAKCDELGNWLNDDRYEEIEEETLKEPVVDDLNYWKANAEEDYMRVPISVLRYISELETKMYSGKEVKELLISCKDRFGGSGLEDYTPDSEVIEWFERNKKK
jgi:hypothetical protein